MPKMILGHEATLIEEEDWGTRVACDFCGADWTGRPESGGLLFGSKAACPDCAFDVAKDAARYGEERFIEAYCPPNLSFAEWVVALAGGKPRKVRTYTLDPIRKISEGIAIGFCLVSSSGHVAGACIKALYKAHELLI